MDDSWMKRMTYEVYRPVKKEYPTRKSLSSGVDHIWTSDLMDMQLEAKENNGMKYGLVVLDMFSRYAWIVPIKDKTGDSVLVAFKSIIETSRRKPAKLWVDQGTECWNSKFRAYLKNDIEMYTTYGQHGAAIAERFIRTIKNVLWRFFTVNNGRNWVDHINDIVSAYNNKKHHTLGMSPNEAIRDENTAKLRTINSQDRLVEKQQLPYKAGAWVRISRKKGAFEKGYYGNWSQAVYRIKEVLKTMPITYKLTDHRGDELKGSFYHSEILPTQVADHVLIEKVLKRRKEQVFVKYMSYDNKYNEWRNVEDTPLQPDKTKL